MRALLVVLVLCAARPAFSARGTLDYPVRRPGASDARVAAPAHAGDAIEIRLRPEASRRAWPARFAQGRAGAPARLDRLGLSGVDRAARDLGGVRFRAGFRVAAPPAPGERDFTAFYVAELPPGTSLESALDRFAHEPEVEYAGPLTILDVSLTPNDSLYVGADWFFQPSRRDIHAPEAWDLTTGDTSIVVAILDSGVQAWHPDLGGTNGGPGQIWTNWAEAGGVAEVDDDGNNHVDDVHGWDFVALASSFDVYPNEDWQNEDNDPSDFSAHGTGMAGLIGAITDNGSGVAGVNWKVRLMPLRVGWAYAGAPLGSSEVRMDFVAEAVYYAARNGANVLNCSFANLDEFGLGLALDEARDAGVLVVTSSGNNGQVNYMATRPEVLAVAATDSLDVVTGFSNKGPQVDLAAPGVLVATTWMLRGPVPGTTIPTYITTATGTSVSAPLVAGAAALLQAHQVGRGLPLLPGEAAWLRLVETTDDIAAQNPTQLGRYGSGRLNVHRALSEEWRSTISRFGASMVGPAAVFRTSTGASRVALVSTNRDLVILDGASLDTVAVATVSSAPVSGVAAGAVGSGGRLGLFVGLDGGVAGFHAGGTPLPGWPVATAAGVRMMSPAIGDLDGDGAGELVCGADDGQVWAWRADGTPVTGFPRAITANPGAVWVGLARFGAGPGVEIMAAAEDGTIALVAGNGATLPDWPIVLSPSPSAPVATRIAGAPALVVSSGGALFAFRSDANDLAGFPVGIGATVGPDQEVAIGDVDTDGHAELVVVTVGPSRIDVRDSTGVSKSALGWPRTLDGTLIGSPVLGHVQAGSTPGIVVMKDAGLVAYGAAGDSLRTFPRPGGAGLRPTLADLDGDGTTEVIAGTGTRPGLLYIYDAGAGTHDPAPQPWPTFRGNASRTGSAVDVPALPLVDVQAPGGVLDLRAAPRGAGEAVLLWTATGDDGGLGQATSYDLRRSGAPIDVANFEQAQRLATGVPVTAGGTDSLRVSGLAEGGSYHFALRALDEDGNRGPLSNTILFTSPLVSPGAVADLRVVSVTDSSAALEWTATGEDGAVGRPQVYVIRASFAPLTEANFATAPYVRIMPATVDAGGRESGLFQSLERGRRYHFGLKAFDAAGNASPLSNIVVVDTHAGGPLAGRPGMALASGRNPSRVPAALYWQAAPEAIGAPHRIRIFDLTGRRVRTLDAGTTAGGIVTWDGRDEEGHRLAAGLFVARLEGGGRVARARVVLLP